MIVVPLCCHVVSSCCEQNCNRHPCSASTDDAVVPLVCAGVNCETEVDECASDPCQNNATCRDLVGRFHCECVTGFAGAFCTQGLQARFQDLVRVWDGRQNILARCLWVALFASSMGTSLGDRSFLIELKSINCFLCHFCTINPQNFRPCFASSFSFLLFCASFL